MFTCRLRSNCFAQIIIRFPKMFWPLRSNFLRSQSKEVHFWNQNVLSSANFLVAIFNFFVFIEGSVSKNKLFPCNMVDIFCTFRDCNVYNFILFFFITKRSFVTFVYRTFYFVVFNSSGKEFNSGTNKYIPKVISPCNLLLYQVVLSFCCLIVFSFVLSLRMSLF